MCTCSVGSAQCSGCVVYGPGLWLPLEYYYYYYAYPSPHQIGYLLVHKCSEGYGTWSVCLSVCMYVSTLIFRATGNKQMTSNTNGFSVKSAQKYNSNFPETTAFELEKLAVSLTNYLAQPIN